MYDEYGNLITPMFADPSIPADAPVDAFGPYGAHPDPVVEAFNQPFVAPEPASSPPLDSQGTPGPTWSEILQGAYQPPPAPAASAAAPSAVPATAQPVDQSAAAPDGMVDMSHLPGVINQPGYGKRNSGAEATYQYGQQQEQLLAKEAGEALRLNDQQGDLSQEVARATQANLLEQQRIAQEQAREDQRQRQIAQASLDQRMAVIDSELQAYKSMRVSQGDALKSLGPVGGAAMALAAFGDVFMKAQYGIETGGQKAIDDWMDRELKAQSENITKQEGVINQSKSLYNMNVEKFKDEAVARSVTKMQLLEDLNLGFQAQAAMFSGKQAKLDADRKSQEIQAALNQELFNTKQLYAGKIGEQLAADKAIRDARAQAAAAARARQMNSQREAVIIARANATIADPNATPAQKAEAMRDIGGTEYGRNNEAYKQQAKAFAESGGASGPTGVLYQTKANGERSVVGVRLPGVSKEVAQKSEERHMKSQQVLSYLDSTLGAMDKYEGSVVDMNARLSGDEAAMLESKLTMIQGIVGKELFGALAGSEFAAMEQGIGKKYFNSLTRADAKKVLADFGVGYLDALNMELGSTHTAPDGGNVNIDPVRRARYERSARPVAAKATNVDIVSGDITGTGAEGLGTRGGRIDAPVASATGRTQALNTAEELWGVENEDSPETAAYKRAKAYGVGAVNAATGGALPVTEPTERQAAAMQDLARRAYEGLISDDPGIRQEGEAALRRLEAAAASDVRGNEYAGFLSDSINLVRGTPTGRMMSGRAGGGGERRWDSMTPAEADAYLKSLPEIGGIAPRMKPGGGV